jgi:hypothetical protein
MASYSTLITDSSTFNLNDIDNTYVKQNLDDSRLNLSLDNAFIFNNIHYSTLYLGTNGIINFTELCNDVRPNKVKNSSIVGFFFPQIDLVFPNTSNCGMYYRERNNIFTVIYNGFYYEDVREVIPYQLKVNFYLSGHSKSGTIEYNYGIIENFDSDSVVGFSFGTSNITNFVQNINLLIPQQFTYPLSPYINIKNNQSSYSNKQISIIPTSRRDSVSSKNNSFVGFSSNKSKQYIRKRISRNIDNM